jgi:hypothetical protein
MTQKKPDNYRVEITHWCRSRDGDDWIDSMYWHNFPTLAEALNHANIPGMDAKHLIESCIYDCRDKYEATVGNLIYRKDWIKDKITDYTTIPNFDYHNREYDQACDLCSDLAHDQ